jgi:predicted TIM-barrel fold metal-dependent hydrolase
MRIDVHQHFWPDGLIRELRARRTPPLIRDRELTTTEGVFPFDPEEHDLDTRLAELDRHGIDVAIVSLQPTLGIDALPAHEAAALVHAYHDGMVETESLSGRRLRGLAVGECRQWFVGATVPASELSDTRRLSPLLDELTAGGRFLFVHPGPAAPAPRQPGWWEPVVDYTQQMQTAFAHWLAAGVQRWPRLHVVFAILAGGAPFQLERLRSRGIDTAPLRRSNTMFDTASYGRSALEFCRAELGASHLVYGSDAPVIDPAPTLGALRALGKETLDAACSANPARLLADDSRRLAGSAPARRSRPSSRRAPAARDRDRAPA